MSRVQGAQSQYHHEREAGRIGFKSRAIEALGDCGEQDWAQPTHACDLEGFLACKNPRVTEQNCNLGVARVVCALCAV